MVVAVVGVDDLAATIDDGVFGRGASPFATLDVVLVVVAEGGRTRRRESARRPRQEIRRREEGDRRRILRGGGGGGGIIIAPSSERAAASSSSSSSSSSYSRGSSGREKSDEDGVGIASPKTNATIHLIFSTDCEYTMYQYGVVIPGRISFFFAVRIRPSSRSS